MQLELFKEGSHYVMLTGDKSKDFLVYNSGTFKMSEDEITDKDLIELPVKKCEVIDNLISEAWSCNCKWLFIMQDEGIYLINTYNDVMWLCRKHSLKFIEMFLSTT